MTLTVDAISQHAMILPPAQRMDLAKSLLESVEGDDAPCPDAAWDAEIRSRMERYDAGESASIPAADVFRRLREIAPVR